MAPASHAAQKRSAAKAARAAALAEKPPVVVEEVPKVQESSSLPAAAAADEGPGESDEPLVLAEEVVPAGKHQGKTFLDVLDDKAFCTWICKEPRRGWMGLFKLYLETEHGYTPKEEDEPEAVDEETAAQEAAVAAARAKLLAKGKGKGAAKKPAAATTASAAKPVAPVARIPFMATKDWQEVLPEHICGRGLQFTMNVQTGKSYARLLPQ
eukprot:TRINITY_DN56901_c0_g1_i1.p1 TRINITY_DN56901_c0_g1~~TRINITY_DN56901_c0_g1_i1.p1  ORF type:complete len:211 (+),score=49.70 TRINITY_DN56901_c0_g1_i1:83-715(+)